MTWIVRVNLDAITCTVSYKFTPRSRLKKPSSSTSSPTLAASTRRALLQFEEPINAGDRVRLLGRPSSSSLQFARYLNIGSSVETYASHAPTRRQTHCIKGRRILIYASPPLGPVTSGHHSHPPQDSKPRSRKWWFCERHQRECYETAFAVGCHACVRATGS